MGLTVLAAAAKPNLITLAVVKDRLSITDSAQDARLTLLIEEASSAIEAYLGRELARQRYTAMLAGKDRFRLELPRFPVDRNALTISIDGAAITDHIVRDAMWGVLFRDSGWPVGKCALGGQEPEENISIDSFIAGYVTPDMIRTWATNLDLVVGDWLRPTSPGLSPYLFECTVAGNTGVGAEPTWPTTAEQNVTAGAATLRSRDAVELPKHLRSCAWLTVYAHHTQLTRPPGLASQGADGFQESYFATHTDHYLPPNVRDALEIWRV